jgi:hypothetical protein
MGSTVSWRLKSPDREFLGAVLGEAEAPRITDAEEHHGDEEAEETPTIGVVRSIEAVFCQYALRTPDASAMTPVARSVVLQHRRSTDAPQDFDTTRKFLGYIVGLEAAVDTSG